MARTISVTKSEVTLNHGSVPFAPPANVVIKNYTTINLNYTFTYSGLGSGKKLFSSSIGAYSNAPLRPGKESEWMETINYWSNTSTVASGSKSFNLSYVPDPSGNPEYPEFDELLPGDEFAVSAHMAIYDVVNYDWAIEDSHISTFEYAEWEPPQIVSYTAYRANSSGTPDDAGTKIRYSMNASVLPLTGYGHGEFFIRYKRPADASWTEVSLGNNITSINVSNVELSGNFPLNESYIIQFVAYDGYVSAVAQTQIYTGTTCMHFNAQKDGIGIGKYSEGPGLDVGWDTRFRGNVQFDNPAAAREALNINLAKLGIQFGTYTCGTQVGGNTGSRVTFPVPFASPPLVFHQVVYHGAGWTSITMKCTEDGPDAEGFTPYVYNSGASNRGTQTFWWMAVGEPLP